MDSQAKESDSELVQAARRGDTNAFGRIIERHGRSLYTFVFKLTANHHDAEDIVQETFLHAHPRLERFDVERPLLPWLFTIARRNAIARWRRFREVAQLESIPEPASQPAVEVGEIWDSARAILSPLEFTTLWMHYQQEYAVKQIAGIIGKTTIHTKLILFRARRKLRQHLEKATGEFVGTGFHQSTAQ